MSYRPRDATLRKLVAYLESLGLEVAGPNVQFDEDGTGYLYEAMRTYTPEDTCRFRACHEGRKETVEMRVRQ